MSVPRIGDGTLHVQAMCFRGVRILARNEFLVFEVRLDCDREVRLDRNLEPRPDRDPEARLDLEREREAILG